MLGLLLQVIAPVRCLYCRKNAVLCCLEHLDEPGQEVLDGIVVHHLFPLDTKRLEVMTAFKDRGVTALGAIFAQTLSSRIAELSLGPDLTVVIPPRNKSNYRRRGYHPAELVARKLGMRVVVADGAKAIRDQRKLTATERAENIKGAFSFRSLANKRVLAFDDVMTTGSTITELVRASRQAGAEVVAGCVLARRFSDFEEGELKKA